MSPGSPSFSFSRGLFSGRRAWRISAAPLPAPFGVSRSGRRAGLPTPGYISAWPRDSFPGALNATTASGKPPSLADSVRLGPNRGPCSASWRRLSSRRLNRPSAPPKPSRRAATSPGRTIVPARRGASDAVLVLSVDPRSRACPDFLRIGLRKPRSSRKTRFTPLTATRSLVSCTAWPEFRSGPGKEKIRAYHRLFRRFQYLGIQSRNLHSLSAGVSLAPRARVHTRGDPSWRVRRRGGRTERPHDCLGRPGGRRAQLARATCFPASNPTNPSTSS